jgi:hypothetical protein
LLQLVIEMKPALNGGRLKRWKWIS